MESLSRTRLLEFGPSRHFASEAHVRIQVVTVPPAEHGKRAGFFSGYRGELLVMCLKGRCRVETEKSGLDLAEFDQALLIDGEPFRLVGSDAEDAVVELIWAPGMNPCRVCWEVDGRFFDAKASP